MIGAVKAPNPRPAYACRFLREEAAEATAAPPDEPLAELVPAIPPTTGVAVIRFTLNSPALPIGEATELTNVPA